MSASLNAVENVVVENTRHSAALGLRVRWLPDVSVSTLRKRKNGASGIIRVDIKCKRDTLVITG